MPKAKAAQKSAKRAAKSAANLNHARRADKATGGALSRARNYLQEKGWVGTRHQKKSKGKK